MSHKHKIAICSTVVLFILFSISSLFASDPFYYKDKNGYFAIIPPVGWLSKRYPQETVRSKITYHHPNNREIFIMMRSGPAPRSNYTLDDWLKTNKNKISNILKKRYPNGLFTIRKSTIRDLDVLLQKNSIPGRVEQHIILALVGNVYHTVTFTATNKLTFSDNRDIYDAFKDSMLLYGGNREFHEKDIREAYASNRRALAELHLKMGDKKSASHYIREGLEKIPDHPGLKDLSKTLGISRIRKTKVKENDPDKEMANLTGTKEGTQNGSLKEETPVPKKPKLLAQQQKNQSLPNRKSTKSPDGLKKTDILSEKEIYKLAKLDFDRQDNESGRRRLNDLFKKYPRSILLADAQFLIAESYFDEKWYEKAVLEYQKVIRKYPKSNKVPASLLKQAVSFKNIGDIFSFKMILKHLVKDFPETIQAKFALKELKELK